MVQRLYIPTTTLNFNNIISSESISPCSFYQLRGYGFKRFEKISLNNLDNLILLYEKYPKFEIEDNELENFPMVIEICLETCPVHIQDCGNGIYSCSETIYLNPFNTSIYFLNTPQLISTKSKAEPSIEAKLVNLYSGCYKVVDSSIPTQTYSTNIVPDINLNEQALNKDIRLDKLKGFFYSYVVASNKSYDCNVVNLKMHSKHLINSLSAIIASPDFSNYKLESEEIKELYKVIRNDVECIEGIEHQVEMLIRQKVQKYSVPNLVEILKEEGLFESWKIKIKNKYNLRSRIEIYPFMLKKNSNKISQLNAYSEYLNMIVEQLNCEKTLLRLEEMPTFGKEHIDQIPNLKSFVVALLNSYYDDMLQKDDFLGGRYKYALKGGTMFRNACGDNWENSNEQRYINSLLRNLNEHTAFDINSTNNQTLKSFAAFFQKGDTEIGKLEDYLVSNGIGNFKVAFALWGIVFGFAAMPKTYTENLFDSDNIEYKTLVYKYIYKAIHNIELVGNLLEHQLVVSQMPLSQDAQSRDKINDDDAPSKKTIPEKLKEKYHTIKSMLLNNSPSQEDFPECLNQMFVSSEFLSMPAKAQAFYKEESLRLWSGENTIEFIDKLRELSFPRTKTKWFKCVKLLDVDNRSKREKYK